MPSRTMTSRERVRTAFALQEPDRVPIGYSANPGIDGRLKAHFGLKPNDHEGLRRALGVDFRVAHAPYVGPKIHPDVPGRHVHPEWGNHTRWVEHESGGYWDYCDFPLKDADEAAVEAWPMPLPNHYDYERVRRQCDADAEHALYVGGAGLGDIINSTGMLCTPERVLIAMATEDPAWLLLVERKLAVQWEVARRTLEAARGRIDLMFLGEDLGAQRGPLISLEMFRSLIRPRHQRFVDLAREFGIPVMIHSCGSSSWAFDDFIDMGISIVDTLQPEAKDMAPAYLKERFGDRLAFHGCISTAGPLAYGTHTDVVGAVKATLEVMMPGGGYCLAPTHAIQDNTPTENAVAMYETAIQYGGY